MCARVLGRGAPLSWPFGDSAVLLPVLTSARVGVPVRLACHVWVRIHVVTFLQHAHMSQSRLGPKRLRTIFCNILCLLIAIEFDHVVYQMNK